jgi:DNA-binding response OmpR family regulator
MNEKILFVEDDVNLAFVVQDNLEAEKFQVCHCTNGQQAWEMFHTEVFDMCIFDVMLPILDGFSLARKVREQNTNIPIIFLSAKSLKEDRIEGLKLGADDYLTKPFSIEELLLKIRIFLRRTQTEGTQNISKIFQIGCFTFDFENLSLQNATHTHTLTLREGELLRFFCENVNKTLKREEILLKIWGDDDYFMGRSLDVFVSRLRKILLEDKNILIENMRNVGFKLKISP